MNKRQQTHKLYLHAKKRIPGGTQLLSKRPELFAPDQWPAYYSKARGCETWDLDGNHYFDMSSNGIGACLLGFCDDDVNDAVERKLHSGSMCTLNPPEEVELADLLCELHPWADQVRFTRAGGDSCMVAIRIARATTRRSHVAICGYHGWHDWYLATNLGQTDALDGHLLPGLSPTGVPRELNKTAFTFKFNDFDECKAIFDNIGDKLAAVIMEPARHFDPKPGFLEHVKNNAHSHGALLIYDEITVGWRRALGGAHLKLDVNPDIAVFAKALGNGHPIGAVIGTSEAMRGAHESFISSTYWTESIGPVAAIATICKMRNIGNLPERIDLAGKRIQNFWKEYGKKISLPIEVENGFACFANFKFTHRLAAELKTLYTQFMLDEGFLAGNMIYPTIAHTDDVVEAYGRAIEKVFCKIANAIENDNIQNCLRGPVAHAGFARLN